MDTLKQKYLRSKNYYMNFTDIIDWLVKNHLPYLERKEKQRINNHCQKEERRKRVEKSSSSLDQHK